MFERMKLEAIAKGKTPFPADGDVFAEMLESVDDEDLYRRLLVRAVAENHSVAIGTFAEGGIVVTPEIHEEARRMTQLRETPPQRPNVVVETPPTRPEAVGATIGTNDPFRDATKKVRVTHRSTPQSKVLSKRDADGVTIPNAVGFFCKFLAFLIVVTVILVAPYGDGQENAKVSVLSFYGAVVASFIGLSLLTNDKN